MASISSATSGLASATGTWAGGVVPVVGDKVTIAHPGTNDLYSTLYQLNGAAAAGATSIPVDTGSGTIVAGECIKVLHQTGTEDGCPTYDPTYYRVTTGITGAGTLVITPGLSYAVADNTQIINCGHVVEVDGTYHWGDDTSNAGTHTANAIVVLGTLKFSRSVNTQLTCRGSLVRRRGILDIGTRGDRIPASVTAVIIANDSATNAAGKHAVVGMEGQDGQWLTRGAVKTRNTTLTAAVTAGGTSITVFASDGWAVGDRIVLASPDNVATKAEVVTISAGSHPTWTVSTLANDHPSGCRIGNLSSNVVFKPSVSTMPASMCYAPEAVPRASHFIDVGDCRFENMGSGAGWIAASSSQSFHTTAFGIFAPENKANQICVTRGAYEQTVSIATGAVVPVHLTGASINRYVISDFAIRLLTTNTTIGIATSLGVTWDINAYVYSSTIAIQGNTNSSVGSVFSGLYASNGNCLSCSTPFDGDFVGADIRGGAGGVIGLLAQHFDARFFNCSINCGSSLFLLNATGQSPVLQFKDCTFTSGPLSGTLQLSVRHSKSSVVIMDGVNGSSSDIRVRNYWQEDIADFSVRNRGISSVKIQPKVANEAIPYYFTVPATAGVSQTIKGFLRFDSTYGAATPPVITLSGQGVVQTFTAPATANAWHDFTFTFTPTTTGSITATVTVQSTSTSGFAWLDGVYHDPMIRSARHYGYLFLLQAALEVDPRITLPEATTAALPIAVDHGLQTITVTGSVTSNELGHFCHYDLCQPANQSQAADFFDFSTTSFETTYTVVIGSGGSVTGNYIDATGTQAEISAPNLPAGSRVQLYNATSSVEIANEVLSGTGIQAFLFYTAETTVRLRASKLGSLPIEAFGVMTASGLTFIDEFVDDDVYIAKGIDGSTVTEFSADEPNVQIDSNDPDGTSSVWRCYAWFRYYETSSIGVAGVLFGAANAIDTENLAIDSTRANIQLDNVSAVPLKINDGYMYRTDGATIISPTSGSIQMDPKKAYSATGSGGGGATAEEIWTHPSRTLVPVGGVTNLY